MTVKPETLVLRRLDDIRRALWAVVEELSALRRTLQRKAVDHGTSVVSRSPVLDEIDRELEGVEEVP